ncbi:MAG: glutamate synthase (NADPH), homotetrameric [Omnitrophica WOR_2 bacterium GWF2_38_59]|nr:MAG: glutamate synthase (NADPH), homotetrameric [Omnitrophica WOR_2 bacterium GWF2_38_59]OGX51225.1 MAG: glutamate synthase (NADPH), homotetrameric [Omnitrophica WOR_2 bacterium RIFOXYA2_FULL_38_17]OGX54804.1 MAG: glutamate synthase (NADPH), homotetrameric [Omnitrophica WOR_2 bacterium RIFOXYA12_FULL_38_10]OGX55346.1 MAG: glutamate synthase (NADPH), homotetrameric [Omnitrophica WOR_2 bacterium RIFOXYB2_FULL_38_16]OGX57935.1 MAG: glutamate synthase (NADPH), homotetrameric [Omnitrophica WOR_2 
MAYVPPKKLAHDAKLLLEELKSKKEPLTPKDRISIPPQEMPAQNPNDRNENMNEVALGYFAEQAKLEAMRCLQCKNAPCIEGCPVRIDIPAFIKAITQEDFKKAIGIIKNNSLLAAVCGRVCPQETQCQEPCTVGKSLKDVNKAVSIGRLERYVADWERLQKNIAEPVIKPTTGKKVAIVGCGPAGITVAADVRREGHAVTIFEAFHKTGGVLVYGIPEFRLPKKIVQEEVDFLKKMGVVIKTNFIVGRTRKLTDLMGKDGYDAVFIGSGAGLPRFMNIEGENLVGVFSANEYLTRSNLMKAYDREHADTPIFDSKIVAVLGGGNVAMDAARTALRIGAKEVHLIYRRTESEMPARVEEVTHAKEEGVIFHILQNAKRIIGDQTGNVKAIECLKYKLGEPDDSGRRRPVVIDGSEFIIDVDTVIVAIGNDSNPLIKQTTPSLVTNKWCNIVVDENCKTSIDGIYAGGDIVLGAATVILAMGQGRIAARSINEYLK